MANINSFLKYIFSSKKKKSTLEKYRNYTYSQEGEDRVLERIFATKKNGFYVDVGAHHPFRFSNTCIFYNKGWSGINIDPLPFSYSEFQKHRSRDINLNIGISENESESIYYMFNEPALNTFDKTEALSKDGIHNGQFYIQEKKAIPLYRLDKILETYLPFNQEIDFMNIDVEGLDLSVLKSNDWNKYRPKVVLVEELRTNIEKIIETSDIYKILTSVNYSLYYRTYNTSFYILQDE